MIAAAVDASARRVMSRPVLWRPPDSNRSSSTADPVGLRGDTELVEHPVDHRRDVELEALVVGGVGTRLAEQVVVLVGDNLHEVLELIGIGVSPGEWCDRGTRHPAGEAPGTAGPGRSPLG